MKGRKVCKLSDYQTLKERCYQLFWRKQEATQFEGYSLDEKIFSFPKCSQSLVTILKSTSRQLSMGHYLAFLCPVKVGQDCKAPFTFRDFPRQKPQENPVRLYSLTVQVKEATKFERLTGGDIADMMITWST